MADKWDAFTTWQLVLPPNRPDFWQLEYIKEKVNSFPNPKVAVLGATIEFRDLLAECGVKDVYVFERNKTFFKLVSTYRKFTNSETLVWGDWLDTLIQFQDNFDFILSDLTSGNIPYTSRDRFYSLIASALTSQGQFIDRILTKPSDFININTLIGKYSMLPVTNRNVNDFNSEVLFCSSLLDNAEHIVDTSAFYDYILSLNKDRITEFVEACYKITPRNCKWWYSMEWEEERKTYFNYFDNYENYDEPSSSAYYKRGKLLISRRK